MRYSYDTEALEEEIFGSGREEGEAGESDDEEMEASRLPDTDAPVTMIVTLQNGTQTEYTVAGVFLEGEKEYIALETQEGDIHIMELLEGEEDDEVRLLPVEEKEEQERAIEAFRYYFDNHPTGGQPLAADG